ncbi:glutamyl-tRNA reductase [bacterium]|nr:glutamyl-tRNA reductase [bacterium]MBU1600326.1 glutamyl-tRNA reductase [bacterium]
MKIATLGINHKRASIEIREMVAISKNSLPSFLKKLKGYFKEAVLLSTCNRTELYVVGPKDGLKERLIDSLLESGAEDLKDLFYFYSDKDVAYHLFRVAAGLDSMVIGEHEILGQVKDAYLSAAEEKATGKRLNRLFHSSFRVARRIRRETLIGGGLSSVSSVACRLAEDVLGNLSTKKILIIGAGKIGKLTGNYLRKKGAENISLCNRTYQKAEELTQRLGGKPVELSDLWDEMKTTDLVISSTNAPHYVIKKGDMERVMETRKRPILLIDIALPRDIEPEVSSIFNVHLYNLDDLQRVVDENISKRKGEIGKAEAIIKEEVEKLSIYSTLAKIQMSKPKCQMKSLSACSAQVGWLNY